MVMKKSYSREFEASPQFSWTNASVISAGATTILSWESYKPTSKKYLPFNFTRVINNSAVEIIVYPNQDTNNPIYVPNGTILSIDRDTIPAVNSFAIKNNGGANVTANQIVISNSRQGVTQDGIVARLHKRLLGGI